MVAFSRRVTLVRRSSLWSQRGNITHAHRHCQQNDGSPTYARPLVSITTHPRSSPFTRELRALNGGASGRRTRIGGNTSQGPHSCDAAKQSTLNGEVTAATRQNARSADKAAGCAKSTARVREYNVCIAGQHGSQGGGNVNGVPVSDAHCVEMRKKAHQQRNRGRFTW